MTIDALNLKIIDSTTGCIAQEIEFSGSDMLTLMALLKTENFDLFGVGYDLEEPDIKAIQQTFGCKNVSASAACLHARGVWDELPYKTHTNRGLLMMLAGGKPLAIFCHSCVPGIESKAMCDEKFEPYVQVGRFIKREHFEIDSRNASNSMRWIFYAFPGEGWRIDSYGLMKETAKLSGWHDGFERVEGSLLGYTDEQNSIHLLQKI